MSKSFPSVTAVIPHYNHGHLIGKQLNSIFSQSVQPTKIIIIDDASTDDSVSVIQELIAGRPNVDLICRENNSGVVAVNNHGLHLADTDYIILSSADDEFLPGFFEKSLNLLHKYPEAALCSTITLAQLGAKNGIFRTGYLCHVILHNSCLPRWLASN